ncbi:MAG: arginase [Bacteroidetes bacterium]|nr:arginase [Bacteroidota bacterium]
MKKIKLIEVKSEIGAGTRGAGLGVDAIKTAALDFGSSFFKRHESVEVPNENRLLLEPVENDFAKRIKGVYSFTERLAKQVSEFCKEEGTFPIVLAGDHTSAIGVTTGIKMAFPEKKLGIIWIDAHADIHSPYTTPSGNMHGMPIATILGEDNKEMQVNKPDEETIQWWEKLKHIGNISPKAHYEDIVMVSVRDFERQEEYLLKKHSVKNTSVAEIRNRGVERVAALMLASLDTCDLIYISFDVDAMDPEISKGTGTPVPGGLTEKEAGNLIYYLLRSKKVCCLEVVEINPTLDKENLMAENAFEILLKATNQLINDF